MPAAWAALSRDAPAAYGVDDPCLHSGGQFLWSACPGSHAATTSTKQPSGVERLAERLGIPPPDQFEV
jgi:hypothetical protein